MLLSLSALSQSAENVQNNKVYVEQPSIRCSALDTLKTKIHLAIYNALKYPASTSFYAATGVTTIKYDYLNGHVNNIHMRESSGNAILDRTALKAVKNAHYPPASGILHDKKISDVVYIVYDNSDYRSRNYRPTDNVNALRHQLDVDSKCDTELK
jgi:TonB family protein